MEQLVMATDAARQHIDSCPDCQPWKADSSAHPCDTGTVLLIALRTEYDAIEN